MVAVYDVIIIGGSYSGLSAAMTLGRALRNVLVIDSGQPCNIKSPYAHNFVSRDGCTPALLSTTIRKQLQKYTTVQLINDCARSATLGNTGFCIETEKGETPTARKLIFATGVEDIMPSIDGFSDCWGISILHCPYCHGFEMSQTKTAIISNGDIGFEMLKSVYQLSPELTLFTNGACTLSTEQLEKCRSRKIAIVEEEIDIFIHDRGKLEGIQLKGGTFYGFSVAYSKPFIRQRTDIPLQIGCRLDEHGLIETDIFQKTTVAGVYACGDNSSVGRSIVSAAAAGSVAAMFCNKEMTEEDF